MAASCLRFRLLWGFTLLFLVSGILGGVLALFYFPGPWIWGVGAVYFAYDSWLLGWMVWLSFRAVQDRQNTRRKEAPPGKLGKTLSLLVCARNERSVLAGCLSALKDQLAAGDEVLVIDDGSTDGSADWMRQEYGMSSQEPVWRSGNWPQLTLLAKEHGGKARALNAGIALASGDVVVTIDADTLLDDGALGAIRRAFEEDSHLAATCGVLKPMAGSKGPLAGLFEFYQTFEYLRGFLWRLAWMRKDMLLLISGAFGAYRRDVLEVLGGFEPASLVEDYDLVYRLHRYTHEQGLGWKTGVIADASARTDIPVMLSRFLHQRTRWFAGFLETLFQNGDMVGNRRYGNVGVIMLAIKTIDALLPLYALASVGLLVLLLVAGQLLNKWVLFLLAAKFLYDLAMHCLAVHLYQKWRGEKMGVGLLLRSLLASCTEPFFFQLVRHLGAGLGWRAFMRGKIKWVPQRTVVAVSGASTEES